MSATGALAVSPLLGVRFPARDVPERVESRRAAKGQLQGLSALPKVIAILTSSSWIGPGSRNMPALAADMLRIRSFHPRCRICVLRLTETGAPRLFSSEEKYNGTRGAGRMGGTRDPAPRA
jgi:hypothetical protein